MKKIVFAVLLAMTTAAAAGTLHQASSVFAVGSEWINERGTVYVTATVGGAIYRDIGMSAPINCAFREKQGRETLPRLVCEGPRSYSFEVVNDNVIKLGSHPMTKIAD